MPVRPLHVNYMKIFTNIVRIGLLAGDPPPGQVANSGWKIVPHHSSICKRDYHWRYKVYHVYVQVISTGRQCMQYIRGHSVRILHTLF